MLREAIKQNWKRKTFTYFLRLLHVYTVFFSLSSWLLKYFKGTGTGAAIIERRIGLNFTKRFTRPPVILCSIKYFWCVLLGLSQSQFYVLCVWLQASQCVAMTTTITDQRKTHFTYYW